MLEKMDVFFENRINEYDVHMMTNIESADVFYPFTAEQLPKKERAEILDLGCGTGLELTPYFARNPSARITGIDLSRKMLERLKMKFPEKELVLICGSYFDVPFGKEKYDGAVSVESLHHFTKNEKIPLYKKLYEALKKNGYFILTDYFSLTDEEERMYFEELDRQKATEGICDESLYHYDTPLTVEHETEALLKGGFQKVEVLDCWGATHILKAYK